MATEPSKLATVRRKDSSRSTPSRNRRDTSGGDHLGVGGDLGRDAQASGRLQVGEVVDVAVERADDVRTRLASLLARVEGMGVRLRDDAHARPSRVPEDGDLGRVGGDGEMQQLVGRDRLAECARVVAELADLCRRLVDEGEHPVGRTDGAGPEQGICGSPFEQRTDPRRVQVELVAAHEQMKAGRVATPYFEPVERAQRDLHGGERFDRRPSARSVEKLTDGLCGAQTVLRDGPACISHSRQDRVDAFELVGDRTGVELCVDALRLRTRRLRCRARSRRAARAIATAPRRREPRAASAFASSSASAACASRSIERREVVATEEIRERIEQSEDAGTIGDRPRRPPADDRDDAAHKVTSLRGGRGHGFCESSLPPRQPSPLSMLRPSRARGVPCHFDAPGRDRARRARRAPTRRPPRSARRGPRAAVDVTRTFRSTWGSRVITEASSSSGLPARFTTSSSCTAVSSPSPVVARSGKQDVTGLLAAERVTAGFERIEHETVTDRGLDDRDAALVHGEAKTEVAHHGHDDGVAAEAVRARADRRR